MRMQTINKLSIHYIPTPLPIAQAQIILSLNIALLAFIEKLNTLNIILSVNTVYTTIMLYIAFPAISHSLYVRLISTQF